MADQVYPKQSVGPRTVVGDSVAFRAGTRGQSIVGLDSQGAYYELASRGMLFSGGTAAAGMTVITGVGGSISPLAAAPTNPILMLINPVGSGVNAALLQTTLNVISGTPGAGGFVYNYAVQTAAITGTTSKGINGLIGGAASVCSILSDTTATGSVAMTKDRLITNWYAGAVAATETTSFVDYVEAKKIIAPGTVLAIAAVALGNSCIVTAAFDWAEIPIT